MRRAGRPGIVAFELVGSVARAEEILRAWGPEGRRRPARLAPAVAATQYLAGPATRARIPPCWRSSPAVALAPPGPPPRWR
jgi:hypothetical protein